MTDQSRPITNQIQKVNERQYHYPIGPEMSKEQWKKFITEMYGEKWFYIN